MPALLPSELPIRARTRHHWVVLLRPPHKYVSIALGVLLLTAVLKPVPMAIVFGVVAAGLAFLRWQTWSAEWILLTGTRIIRVQGVPETTSSESWLRVDRISGARLVETVPGKVLRYGTIELEAPGDHPDVRRLHKIADARVFYLQLRHLVFGDGSGGSGGGSGGGGDRSGGGGSGAGGDPDDAPFGAPTTYGSSQASSARPPVGHRVTQPLPVIDDPGPYGWQPRW